MIRQLRLTDLLTQILPGRLATDDLVVTHDEIGVRRHRLTPAQIAKWSLSPSSGLHPIAAGSYTRLDALAVLRPRYGPKAWEVAHLFAADGADEQIESVLKQAARFASSRRGERLFIRLPNGSDEIRIAKQTGFREAFTEDVYKLPRAMSGDLHAPSLNVRPPLPSDTYGIFRLYSAVSSSSARSAVGLTLDQWQDSREGSRKDVREYVWEHDQRIAAWIRLAQRGGALTVDAMLHPDAKEMADALVTFVARLAWGHEEPSWIVASSQPGIAEALTLRGWQRTQTYAVLVRPLADHVEEFGLAAASA
ncbi:MAG: hypothetical protein O3B65_06765 [Chloroflexi bacterium]|nr:hypothetical protein [Chloroflexota bacterium]